VLLLTVFAQRQIVAGLSAGAVKGGWQMLWFGYSHRPTLLSPAVREGMRTAFPHFCGLCFLIVMRYSNWSYSVVWRFLQGAI
jgi:hypothetical protein